MEALRHPSIPEAVKIRGRIVPVRLLSDACVDVGETRDCMDQETRLAAKALTGDAHREAWQTALLEVYKRALGKERERIKAEEAKN